MWEEGTLKVVRLLNTNFSINNNGEATIGLSFVICFFLYYHQARIAPGIPKISKINPNIVEKNIASTKFLIIITPHCFITNSFITYLLINSIFREITLPKYRKNIIIAL